MCSASDTVNSSGIDSKQSKGIYNNKLVYTVFLTVYGVIMIANGVMETQLDSDSSSRIDTIKNTMMSISNGDTSVVTGYDYISDYDDQTPKNFFKIGGIGFDIFVEPPTEKTDWWSVGVFGTRRAIDMLYIACHKYDSRAYNAVSDSASRTDRMFHGDEDSFIAETGFLQQLVNQSRRNQKHGFAHKMTTMPHSQEMMDKVYTGVANVLDIAMYEATHILNSRIINGVFSIDKGGFSLD